VSDQIPTSPTGKRLERPILASSLPRLEPLQLLERNRRRMDRIVAALVLWTILLAILFGQFAPAAMDFAP
jgi:hypothetical protein